MPPVKFVGITSSLARLPQRQACLYDDFALGPSIRAPSPMVGMVVGNIEKPQGLQWPELS